MASPYCLVKTTAKINSSSIVSKAMAKGMVKSVKEHLLEDNFVQAMRARDIDIEAVLACKDSDAFNERFSMKFSQHRTLQEYKLEASSTQYIRHIKIPALAINSVQDAVVPYSAIPFDEIKRNPNFIQIIAHCGGHLEYYSTSSMRRWAFDTVLAYFRHLENQTYNSETEDGLNHLSKPPTFLNSSKPLQTSKLGDTIDNA